MSVAAFPSNSQTYPPFPSQEPPLYRNSHVDAPLSSLELCTMLYHSALTHETTQSSTSGGQGHETSRLLLESSACAAGTKPEFSPTCWVSDESTQNFLGEHSSKQRFRLM